MDLERFPTSESAKRMIASVSEEFYAKSYVAKWLYQVMGLEWDMVWRVIETLPEQVFPETATWGLMYHEMKWGLPIREDLDYETRQRLIYAKRDTRSPVNPWIMEQLVYNLSGKPAHVSDSNEDPDIPANTFTLEINNGELGEGAADLYTIIRRFQQIKQSHVTFTATTNTHMELISLPIAGTASSTSTDSLPLWRDYRADMPLPMAGRLGCASTTTLPAWPGMGA